MSVWESKDFEEFQLSYVPSTHPHYNDRSSELLRELRHMNKVLSERIMDLHQRLIILEAWAKAIRSPYEHL
jgi:hypothetical protein